jgi:hypothetical protein
VRQRRGPQCRPVGAAAGSPVRGCSCKPTSSLTVRSHSIPMASLAADYGVALNFDLGLGNGQDSDRDEGAAGETAPTGSANELGLRQRVQAVAGLRLPDLSELCHRRARFVQSKGAYEQWSHKPARPRGSVMSQRATGLEFLDRLSIPQNSQVDRSGQDTSSVAASDRPGAQAHAFVSRLGRVGYWRSRRPCKRHLTPILRNWTNTAPLVSCRLLRNKRSSADQFPTPYWSPSGRTGHSRDQSVSNGQRSRRQS